MAFANRISDLARTLAQYPTFVTVMDNKVDVRTKEQLGTLSAETAKLEALAAEGDTAIVNGTCTDPAGLSSRLSFNASQISSLLTAFAAQDSERLKSMSIISKQKFDGYAKNRLGAEKRFSDEVSTLLTQEAKAVAGLAKSESGKPDAKPDTGTESPSTPKPEDRVKPPPSKIPSVQDTISALPGYLRATIPEIVKKYDDAALSTQSKSYADAAIKLGANSSAAVRIYVVLVFTFGPDFLSSTTKIGWVNDIINNPQLGTIDQRILILRNAVEMRRKLDLPI
ncbi:hypothetical protein [Thalassospira profundimaris]|jgi:hypothetical protein|uniref:hypothetical protein n=1 Tax=Thalassospira profundimaris TaxID=502049 RepID=UPI00028722A9|nr:hypothetical protein [Thalassospira profundimaris]EKF07150.1 hypothetical protein TH2_14707 [Thalassospira profundimaris WP0211]